MTATFDFGVFPELMTQRTTLCEIAPAYADDLFMIRSDPEVQKFNSVPHQTVAETLKFIAEVRESYDAKKQVVWAVRIRGSDRVIGSVCLFDWERYHRRAGMGYDLARDCWGHGYAQEAIRVVIQFGFEVMSLNRLEIWTSAVNSRSVRLAERLGFTREGRLRNRILEDDSQFHDCVLFGLLRSDWASVS